MIIDVIWDSVIYIYIGGHVFNVMLLDPLGSAYRWMWFSQIAYLHTYMCTYEYSYTSTYLVTYVGAERSSVVEHQ